MGNLQLTGPELKPFQDEIVKLYDLASLKRLLFYSLDKNLHAFAATQGDFTETASDVVFRANSHHWIDDLINAVAKDVKDESPFIQEFAKRHLTPKSAIIPPFTRQESKVLEKIVTEESKLQDFGAFLDKLKLIGNAVCRVSMADGSGGTGFLIAPDFVLTNYHVVENSARTIPATLAGVRCIFDFKSDDATGTSYDAVPDWKVIYRKYSPSDIQGSGTPAADELDYAILKLQQPVGNLAVASEPKRGWLDLKKAVALPPPGRSVFIVQHPIDPDTKRQTSMKLALGIVEAGSPSYRFRYDTSTRPGSSGSPVLDDNLGLVALHHAGDPLSDISPKYNQGIPMNLILEDLESQSPGILP